MTEPRRPMRSLPRRAVSALFGTGAGVALLAAVAVYLAIASLPEGFTRGLWGSRAFSGDWLADWLATTPNGLYAHPLLLILTAWLAVAMVVATFARVPFRPAFLGTYLAHAGVLVLLAGGMVYGYGHRSAVCGTWATADGYEPIDTLYDPSRWVLNVRLDGDPNAAPLTFDVTDWAVANPAAGPQPLQFNLPDGQAVRIEPTGRFAEVAAAQVHVKDDTGQRTVLIAPALPGMQEYAGDGYALFYKPGLTPEGLKAFGKQILSRPSPFSFDVAYLTPRIPDALEGACWWLIQRPDGSLAVPIGRRGRCVAVRARNLREVGDLFTLISHILELRLWQSIGQTVDVKLGGQTVKLTVQTLHSMPAMEMQIQSQGSRRTAFVPHVQSLPGCGGVRVGAGERALRLVMSPAHEPLGASLTVTGVEASTYPHSVIPKDYVTDLIVHDSGSTSRPAEIALNKPLHIGPWQIGHGQWLPAPAPPGAAPIANHRLIYNARTRPGLWVVWTGCAMILLAMPWSFYVKPWLLRRRARRAA